jgi:hypothetical protein
VARSFEFAEDNMLTTCPSCNRQLNVPDNLAGQQVRCPLCQAVFPVSAPAPGGAAPPPPPAPPPPHDPYARRGPEEPEQDIGYTEERTEGAGRVQPLLNRGAIHLLISAILFSVMLVVTAITDFVQLGMVSDRFGFRPPGYMAGVMIGLILRILLVATPIVFMFIGSNLLRRARGRGLVMTACILGIVLAGLCTIGLLVQMIGLTQIDRVYGSRAGAALALTALSAVVVLAATVYGYIAGIGGLMVLARSDVKHAYGLRPPRRVRYDDRRDRYDQERW